jgi:SAM-dependent methyltransferase
MVAEAVEEFVRASLPPPPARVLEVGAGSGDLARLLTGLGYDLVAIDPAGEGHVVPVALLDLDALDASFDAAVAVVSLHHVEPFEDSCRRLAAVVRPGGTFVVDEFDVDRFDEPSAGWLLERWREAGRSATGTRPTWSPSSGPTCIRWRRSARPWASGSSSARSRTRAISTAGISARSTGRPRRS